MRKLTILGLLIVSLSLCAMHAAAQTPDGQTPAQETVCDVLKTDDNAPKGLYGLCVAFCEAQDADEIVAPADLMTEEDIQAKEDSIPSQRILANFIRKAEGTDYVMPCLEVDDDNGCPCWNETDIVNIDCDKYEDYISPSGSYRQTYIQQNDPLHSAVVIDAGQYLCEYNDFTQEPPLNIQVGSLDAIAYFACRNSVLDRIAECP